MYQLLLHFGGPHVDIFLFFTVSLLSLITPCVVGDPRIVFWFIFDDSSPRSEQGLVFYSFDVMMTG